MKIAIASTDGITVNEHFGKAKKFLIYDAAPEGLKFLKEREVEPYSTGRKDHNFDKVRFEEVVTVLEGCEKVFIAKIGDEPAAALKAMGIKPVVYEGAIKDIELCR